MKHILVILLSIVSVTVYSQSPRIKLNQIVKDNAVGSILISNPTDSQMVYSRDFFINFGTDTTLVLFGDTIGGGISTVVTDLVTIQGDGSIATPLYVDTSVINTIKGMVDTLAARGYLTTEVDGSTTNEIQTLSKVGQTVSLSLSGGSFTDDVLTETEVDAFVANNGYLTSEVDGSISNEGSLTVQAGGANDSEIQSNTSGSTNVTIAGGSNVTVTESGNTITIASTASGGGSIPVDTFVTIAGTETITGAKTFTSDLNVDAKIALNAGDDNVVIGDGAGASLVSGQALNNVLIGTGVGSSINSADNNVGIGYQALYNNTSANGNTGIGYQALYSDTTGRYNTAIGYQALHKNTTAEENLGIGVQALYSNTTGNLNVAIGSYALQANTTAKESLAIGSRALFSNKTGNSNLGIGVEALSSLNSGSSNQAYGENAGRYLSDGSTPLTNATGSLFLGSNTKASANGNSNEIVIGTNAIGNGNNSVTIGNDGTIGTATTKTILNGNVGIGTTAPSAKLEVSGGDANFDSGTLYVDESENRVGIGTSSPSETLDVNGNGLFTGNLTVNGTTLTANNYEFDIDQTVSASEHNYVLTYDSLDGQISLEPATGGTATIPVDTFVTIAGTDTITGAKTFTNTFTQSGGDANFDNNTLYVDESADMVGIGKNNPSYKLDVNGDVNSEVKYIKLRRNSNLALSTTSLTNVTWDNTVAKDDDIFSHTSGQEQIYADVSGLYHITVNLSFFNDDLVDRSTIRARLVKNTTVQTHSAGYTYLRGSIGHINGTITISDMIELSTNDYVFVILDIVDSDGTNETLIATESQIIIRRLGY